jgi:type IV pilus assembly protein PilV
MIEVLVTMVIIAFGLLGMAGLQMRMQASELESYQRSQAILLLNDMANRIAVGRNNAGSYVTGTGTPLGTGANCGSIGTTPMPKLDLTQWCNALQGAAETATEGGVTVNRGAMIGARGCVEKVGSDYVVTVAWQGMVPISAPPSSVGCGLNQYNGATTCQNDLCRRYVTTLVRVANL